MKRAIYRIRQHAYPANPKTLADLDDVPDEYKTTLTKKKEFLMYDSYSADEDNGAGNEEARREK